MTKWDRRRFVWWHNAVTPEAHRVARERYEYIQCRRAIRWLRSRRATQVAPAHIQDAIITMNVVQQRVLGT